MGHVWAGKADLSPRGVRCGGVSTTFYTGRLCSDIQPLPFYIPFYGEKVPFPVPSINYYYSLLTAVNALTLRFE